MNSSNQNSGSGALGGLRVLDLSRRYSYYCGKLFADMGADVILVEVPRTGAALRTEAPFLEDKNDPAFGIPFFYYNTSKRGITLDWKQPTGREILLKLVAQADVLIEDSDAGVMDALGLSYEILAQAQPRLVVTSITPFGRTGPYSHDAADDLTLLAMGGFLNMMGYPDVAPTQAYGNQAYAMGNMFGAVGAMIAVLGAQASGRGQLVDVSIQECVSMAMENAAQFYDLEKKIRTRFGDTQRHAGTGIFECADGYIYIFVGGMAAVRFWPNFIKWMNDERVPGSEVFTEAQWSDIDYVNSDPAKDVFSKIFSGFAKAKTKKKLYHEGQARRVPLCPVSTAADIAENRQLEYRSYFSTVKHAPSGRDVVMPGAPFNLAGTPWRIARPAPALGEHNAEIFTSIGILPQDVVFLAAAGVV